MRHIPVLINEVNQALAVMPGMNVIDCTLGDGGHAEVFLEKSGPNGKLLGIDADSESLLRAKRYLYRFEDRLICARDNFIHLKKIVEETKFDQPGAILIDLGWSSPQFEERGRGFSFIKDEPLDMRFDTNSNSPIAEFEGDLKTAADLLNNLAQRDLAKIFKNYGEEKLYKEIAQAVVDFRKSAKIERTGVLTELVLEVYRKKLSTNKEVPWVGGLHPATKVFQALRICVNQELEALKQALPQALEILKPGGRLAVISFHSLEDRIVKHYFQSVVPAVATFVNKKPIIASNDEIEANPRARSAKLRVIQKI